MRYVIYNIRRLLLMMLPGVAAYYLVARIGIGMTLGAIAAAAAFAVAIAGILLHTSELSKITWKNRVAGPLAPWGWRFSKGKLMRALFASWVIWILLAVPGILIATRAVPTPVAASQPLNVSAFSSVIMVLLAIVWVIDGGALLWVFATLSKNFSMQSSSGKSLLKVMAFCVLVLVSSVSAFLGGHSLLALTIAGTPPLGIGLFFAVYLGIILSCGKNMRWN